MSVRKHEQALLLIHEDRILHFGKFHIMRYFSQTAGSEEFACVGQKWSAQIHGGSQKFFLDIIIRIAIIILEMF